MPRTEFPIGSHVIARGLAVSVDKKWNHTNMLPPRIALVVSLEPLRIKLRVGGPVHGTRGGFRWAPKARSCKPENLTRLATAREVFLGLCVGPP